MPPSGGATFDDKDDEPSMGSWVPVIDSFNAWASVSSYHTCDRWSDVHGGVPEWGDDEGKGREESTRHLPCCGPGGVGTGTYVVANEEAVEEADKHDNEDHEDYRWFDREDGWDGTTYAQAVEFCGSKENMVICPSAAICPDGANGPFDFADDGSEEGGGSSSWAPILDDFNDWIKIGGDNLCVRWSSLNEKLPGWGLDGDEESITRHVMCCKTDAMIDEPTFVAEQNSDEEEVLDATTVPATVATAEQPGMHDEMGPHRPPLHTATATTAKVTAGPTTQPPPKPSATLHAQAVNSHVSQTLEDTRSRYSARWHDRDSGWDGRTYTDAFKFCAEHDSSVPCPYEAYCPLGPNEHVVGIDSIKRHGIGAVGYAPIVDVPNGWVSIGTEQTCVPYNAFNPYPPEWGMTGRGNEEMTRFIMCCHEPEEGFGLHSMDEEQMHIVGLDVKAERSDAEQRIMDRYHPAWFGRRHGYKGTTHENADEFCNNVGKKRLCPLEAYCPNGSPASANEKKALYVDRAAFAGEQWAPFNGGNDNNHRGWVLVGTAGDDNPTTTCSTYHSLVQKTADVSWAKGASPSDHKRHVLCCDDDDMNNEGESPEETARAAMRPVWFDQADGWSAGSHSHAVDFCLSRGGREPCPYSAYCPRGEGSSVMGGNAHDFDSEGEQWAPIDPEGDAWVMIGRKYGNSATTCMTFERLEGFTSSSDDLWGGSKRHIMCCYGVEAP